MVNGSAVDANGVKCGNSLNLQEVELQNPIDSNGEVLVVDTRMSTPTTCNNQAVGVSEEFWKLQVERQQHEGEELEVSTEQGCVEVNLVEPGAQFVDCVGLCNDGEKVPNEDGVFAKVHEGQNVGSVETCIEETPTVSVEQGVEYALIHGPCLDELNLTPRFDPITSIECCINPTELIPPVSKDSLCLGNESGSSTVFKSKRPRGRPKRVVCSLPEPLLVPSTPSKSIIEAQETWNIAKSLGIKAVDERATLSELRKSKRLLVMEENNPVLG